VNVREAIELLSAIPGHLPLVVEDRRPQLHDPSLTVEYLITLDIQRSNFPTQGGMAVVILKD